jgi:hypothetical protein
MINFEEGAMALRFLGIDPETDGGQCPAVFVDEQTGDMLFQGWTVDDANSLAEAAAHSPLASNETLVRLPCRMRDLIREAMDATGTIV